MHATVKTIWRLGVVAFCLCAAADKLPERRLGSLASHVAQDAESFLQAEEGARTLLLWDFRDRSENWDVPLRAGGFGQPDFESKLTKAFADAGFRVIGYSQKFRDLAQELPLTGGGARPADFSRAAQEFDADTLVYGYLLDVPGKDHPQLVIKMTDLRSRLLIWGGVFSPALGEDGDRREVLFAQTGEIAGSLVKGLADGPTDYSEAPDLFPRRLAVWRTDREEGGAGESQEWRYGLHVDLLSLALLRLQQDGRDSARKMGVVDNQLLFPRGGALTGKPGAAPAGADDDSLTKMLRASRASLYEGLKELAKPDTWSLQAFALTAANFVPAADKPTMIKIVSPEGAVLGGYCSQAGANRKAREWVGRAAVRLRFDAGESPLSTFVLRPLVNPQQIDMAPDFLEVVEIALALNSSRKKVTVLDVWHPASKQTDTVFQTAVSGEPGAVSLQCLLLERKTRQFIAGADVPETAGAGGSTVDEVVAEAVAELAERHKLAGAQDERGLIQLWSISEEAGAEADPTAWSAVPLGYKIAARLLMDDLCRIDAPDDVNPFQQGDYPFHQGDYHDIARRREFPVLSFRRFARQGAASWPGLCMKHFHPLRGQLLWAYYGLRGDGEVDVALDRKLASLFRKLPPEPGAEADASALIGQFRGIELLPNANRAQELFVVSAARRCPKQPIEMTYFKAKSASDGLPDNPFCRAEKDAEAEKQAKQPRDYFGVGSFLIANAVRLNSDVGGRPLSSVQPEEKFPGIQFFLREVSLETCDITGCQTTELPSESDDLCCRVATLLVSGASTDFDHQQHTEDLSQRALQEIVAATVNTMREDMDAPSSVVVQLTGDRTIALTERSGGVGLPSLAETLQGKGLQSGKARIYVGRTHATGDLPFGQDVSNFPDALRRNLEHALVAGSQFKLKVVAAEAVAHRVGRPAPDDYLREDLLRELASDLSVDVMLHVVIQNPRLVFRAAEAKSGLFKKASQVAAVRSCVVRTELHRIFPEIQKNIVLDSQAFQYAYIETDFDKLAALHTFVRTQVERAYREGKQRVWALVEQGQFDGARQPFRKLSEDVARWDAEYLFLGKEVKEYLKDLKELRTKYGL